MFERKGLDIFCGISKISLLNAGVAQLVERNLAKVEVASSRLVSRSRFLEKGKSTGFPFFPVRLRTKNI